MELLFNYLIFFFFLKNNVHYFFFKLFFYRSKTNIEHTKLNTKEAKHTPTT